jgi:hypothetical protein
VLKFFVFNIVTGLFFVKYLRFFWRWIKSSFVDLDDWQSNVSTSGCWISRRLSNGGLGNVSTLGRLISGIEPYLT